MVFIRHDITNAKTEIVSERWVRVVLAGNCKNIDLAISAMKNGGGTVSTPGAIYSWRD